MSRVRSPSYPSYSLEEAIENVRKVFDEDRRNPIDREVVAKHMGYSGLNGAADKSLSTMMQYGLFEKVAKGEVRVSQLAVDILHPDQPEQRRLALYKAAFSPDLFQTLRERFTEGMPSAGSLKSYLLRENFNDRAVGPIINAYTKTCALLDKEGATYDDESFKQPRSDVAGLNGGREEEDEKYGNASVGDLVQWVKNGALQLPQPARVRAIAENGDWIFIEESETGIPMNQVLVLEQMTRDVPLDKSKLPPVMPKLPIDTKEADGERIVYREEGAPGQYLKLVACGDLDDYLLEAVEDFVKRQRKRLGLGASEN